MNAYKLSNYLLVTTTPLALVACGGSSNRGTPVATTYTIGGTVSGLLGSDLVLQNNGGSDIDLSADGGFTFTGRVASGANYSVTVLTQPNAPTQTCGVTNGAGTVDNTNVTRISVSCATDTFVVGGTVSNLKGSGLLLQNNAGDDLSIANDGSFTFATPIPSGEDYSVTVLTDPTDLDQACTIIRPAGTVSDVDVVNVSVNCTALTVRQIDAGGWVTCAIFDNEQTKCWGHNNFGSLGLGDGLSRGSSPKQMGNDLGYVSIDSSFAAEQIAAGTHSCAVLANGSVKCWGSNSDGQLGAGDTENRGDHPDEMGSFLAPIDLGTGRTATHVGIGGGHTCALLDNAKIKCWGRNANGQLGIGDTTRRGILPGEMGNNLAETRVSGPLSFNPPRQLAVGGDHNCTILDNNNTKCWGLNSLGQLGLGDTENRGNDANEMGAALPSVNLGTGRFATQVVAGNSHSCALLDNGNVKCWGRNSVGQLGLGDPDDRGIDPSEMGNNLATVDLGSVNLRAIQIAAGNDHTCALLDNRQMKCWGSNSRGQLGLSDLENRGDQANEMGFKLPFINLGPGQRVTSISAGATHTCALLDTDETKCWGENHYGQLGQENVAPIGDALGEMGNNLDVIDVGSQ